MSATTKCALVTGAGTGVGRAAVLGLARTGFAITLVGRRREPLKTVAAEAEALGARTVVAVADLTKPDELKAAFAAHVAAFGRLDVLFNNAGIGAPAIPLEDLTLAQWQAVVDTNLTAPFLCTQEAFRIMKAQVPMGGRIINNGSISAYAPRPNSAPYTATKHAISGLTRSTALDGRRHDIACGQIDIGNAATEMAMKMASGVPQANGQIAVEPLMDPVHVGDAIAYMANLPLDANALFLNIMATKMPFVGRG